MVISKDEFNRLKEGDRELTIYAGCPVYILTHLGFMHQLLVSFCLERI